ncbi:hypothetical protein EJ110_NYTH19525 [Nymphaea thermarum]|nr:hypothetical protein EJ110_NYTH19525 [Nymphaea thermarum]
MAEEMVPKSVAAFDTGSTPKSGNLSVQVTSIRLTKDNYLSWSAAHEIGITSRGHLSYITGDKPAPNKSDPQWVTWALEDSQVKVWIISFVSADIQPLILRKPTSFDMWTVLARMYGRKKRVLRTYQIKRSIYSLKQGDLSVDAFYAALKTKWEELDYHSQILNCDEIPGIEEVYARVESEEQRRQRLVRGRPPSSRRSPFVPDSSQSNPSSGTKSKLSSDQLKERQAYISRLSTTPEEASTSEGAHLAQALVASNDQVEDVEDVDRTNPSPVTSPNDPSPLNEELPIALRKGTRKLMLQLFDSTPLAVLDYSK